MNGVGAEIRPSYHSQYHPPYLWNSFTRDDRGYITSNVLKSGFGVPSVNNTILSALRLVSIHSMVR
jgi:hypothetical protein